MQKTSYLLGTLTVALMSAGPVSAQVNDEHFFDANATKKAAPGRFYDPRNAASPTGYTTGHELFRTIGCPGRGLVLETPCDVEDSDGDGVYDYRDKCPGTPPGRKVNADGCELDRDGDGIVDGADRCPDVYAKTPDGCPPAAAAPDAGAAPLAAPAAAAPAAAAPAAAAAEPAAAPLMALRGPNFDFDRAVIRGEDYAKLDEAVEMLRASGDVKVEIAGHTDSTGTEAYNQGLSIRRAEAVRRYLVDKGIADDRLIVKGYGELQPVADNGTREGRFMNRRVELIPQQ
jgi:OOP family OmpA-OmpF porin